MLRILYNLLAYLFELIMPFLTVLSPKMKLFVVGRIHSKKTLETANFSNSNWIWFHCASLGEFEQAVPLIERLKVSSNKILVTFFSPSGYEIKKHHKLIDRALYLPIDTPKNAQFLIEKIQPKVAFFIKYDIWENYFKQLSRKNIPIYMVSSTFRANQIYFKWYSGFFKNTLKNVTHFFVQNEESKRVLEAHSFTNVTVSGDTRFDRVNAQLKMDNKLEFIENFKEERVCVVLGSTWPDCEVAFVKAIEDSAENVCFIIAPHEIKKDHILKLKAKLNVDVSIFSEGVDFNSKVLIIDAIGYLTKIYSYADIAYVGGAIGETGLHNILEPAVFGLPILVGPNTKKFPEAKVLEKLGGLKVVANQNEFKDVLNLLVDNEVLRNEMSAISENYIKHNVGATNKIITKIEVSQNKMY